MGEHYVPGPWESWTKCEARETALEIFNELEVKNLLGESLSELEIMRLLLTQLSN
jgi:hypothetical protein